MMWGKNYNNKYSVNPPKHWTFTAVFSGCTKGVVKYHGIYEWCSSPHNRLIDSPRLHIMEDWKMLKEAWESSENVWKHDG